MTIHHACAPSDEVRLIAGDEQATWLLLAHPYARPTLVAKHLVPKARLLIRMGLLEREPTVRATVCRCTERGEEVANELLKHFSRGRV